MPMTGRRRWPSVYLHFHDGPRPGTVLTVHNLAFQGRYRASLFPRLGLPEAAFALDGWSTMAMSIS